MSHKGQSRAARPMFPPKDPRIKHGQSSAVLTGRRRCCCPLVQSWQRALHMRLAMMTPSCSSSSSKLSQLMCPARLVGGDWKRRPESRRLNFLAKARSASLCQRRLSLVSGGAYRQLTSARAVWRPGSGCISSDICLRFRLSQSRSWPTVGECRPRGQEGRCSFTTNALWAMQDRCEWLSNGDRLCRGVYKRGGLAQRCVCPNLDRPASTPGVSR